jgi:hypothetical protein
VSPALPDSHLRERSEGADPALSRFARPLGRLGLAAFFVIALVALMFGVANNSWSVETGLQVLAFAAFAVVGAILLDQAAHPIGAICLAVGIGGAIGGFAQEYADYAQTHAGVVGVDAADLLEAVVGFPATILAFTFLPLLFPDGRLPSRRWRPVAWLALLDIAVLVLGFGFTERRLFEGRRNPVVLIPPGPPADFVLTAASVLTVVTGILCASALLVRYWSADAVTRQQLKWVAAAVAIFAVGLTISILVPPLDTFASVLPVIPIAVGIAVLRYRLYDIDVLINRALVYIPLTAALGGLYAASVALFQRLFIAVTGESSDAAIVVTTLILAAAFTPARKALEGVAERRYRSSTSWSAPSGADAPDARVIAIDDPELERRMAAIARAAVDEALADRARIGSGKRRSISRGG